MAPNLIPGTFKIVSLIEGEPPTSVNFTKPTWQTVYLNGPVTTWVIGEGSNRKFRFSLGGYPFTGVLDDKVTATIHQEQGTEWIAIYREHQDAYTISPVDDESKGWTVADDSPNAQIVVRVIIAQLSNPPQFSTGQLFRFDPANDEE